MKSFIQYLVENKRVYEFKIKIAGTCPKDCAAVIKNSLTQFVVDSCSAGKSVPIQETSVDFPNHANIGITVFDVCVAYPATSHQVANLVSQHLQKSPADVCVRSLREQELISSEQMQDANGKALLTAEYDNSDHQDLVGEKGKENFLKELTKNKTNLAQITGSNDTLLAKKIPSQKNTVAKKTKISQTKSPIGSR